MHLPTKAIIKAVYQKQASKYANAAFEIDEAKLGASLAWARMMVTANDNIDPFEVVTSLFMGILNEQPASKGNPALAFSIVVLTLGRNGLMLDISNEDVIHFYASLAKGEFTENSLTEYFRTKSIPYW